MRLCRLHSEEPGFNCRLPPIGGQSRIAQGSKKVCTAAASFSKHLACQYCITPCTMSLPARSVGTWSAVLALGTLLCSYTAGKSGRYGLGGHSWLAFPSPAMQVAPCKVALVSTYAPKNCGLATFTAALVQQLRTSLGLPKVPIVLGAWLYFLSRLSP